MSNYQSQRCAPQFEQFWLVSKLRALQYLQRTLTISLKTSVWVEGASGFFSKPPIAPTITSIIPISIMKNEIPIAKKFAVSNTTTNTEKTSRNTPVKLVILVPAGLDC